MSVCARALWCSSEILPRPITEAVVTVASDAVVGVESAWNTARPAAHYLHFNKCDVLAAHRHWPRAFLTHSFHVTHDDLCDFPWILISLGVFSRETLRYFDHLDFSPQLGDAGVRRRSHAALSNPIYLCDDFHGDWRGCGDWRSARTTTSTSKATSVLAN